MLPSGWYGISLVPIIHECETHVSIIEIHLFVGPKVEYTLGYGNVRIVQITRHIESVERLVAYWRLTMLPLR